jgi:hypothetical protein
MPSLPTLTPAEIEAELKGSEYDLSWTRQADETLSRDARINAARAIRLARENEELRAKLAIAISELNRLQEKLNYTGNE